MTWGIGATFRFATFHGRSQSHLRKHRNLGLASTESDASQMMKCHVSTMAGHSRPYLANQTEAADAHIKYKKGIYGQRDAVFDHARAPENAHPRSQRPCDQDNVGRNSGDGRKTEGAQYRGDDEGKEGVSDDTD